MAKDLLIGSHVSMNGPEYYLGSVKEAISYGATTFMFYTGAPQNSFRKPLDELKIKEGRSLLKEHGFDESKIVVHAPYIINAANPSKPELLDLSIKTIINELQRTEAFGASMLVLHPGNHLGAGPDAAIDVLADSLDNVFANDSTNVKIAIETMAGKGSEIGTCFEQVRDIIDKCHYKDRLGVCLDTCHVSDAGYDVNDTEGLLNEFDKVKIMHDEQLNGIENKQNSENPNYIYSRNEVTYFNPSSGKQQMQSYLHMNDLIVPILLKIDNQIPLGIIKN